MSKNFVCFQGDIPEMATMLTGFAQRASKSGKWDAYETLLRETLQQMVDQIRHKYREQYEGSGGWMDTNEG